ncbi:sulfatase-like hydrolase/transferase [Polaribacter pectinis]|uniref:Sulfatase-like hydrolase/transferase n=1 Tax=Polaribacter pectinis TaxID=2738844 RepID=A0A7G9LE25_9FLAO|nr:alkaline phosphatase family protein [Polaribacter pectinis]QNM86874.1 sulfatase-like hydrolase/transferase [Polaribacter pectinis]
MKNLTNRLLCYVSYFLLWVGYFIFARFFFLLFYFDKTQELGFTTALKTFAYGIRLDLSFAAYLSFIPFLLMIFSVFVKSKKIEHVIKWYSYILLIFITLLLIIDASLYQSWGVRLDTSLLPYLNTPELMVASVSTFQMISGIIFWGFISYVFIKLFSKIITKKLNNVNTANWIQAPIFLIITAALIIPVRGGLQTIPVNQSNVYFSDKMFANHAAINFIWNFSNTLTHKTDGKNPYKYFDEKVAKNIINKTKNKLLISDTDSILNTTRPNVILIIWEGLTAKVVGSLGGEPTVTENLNKISKEGILFTNFYANGDRTDKGIPAILSGYYPAPVKRIMRMPNKTRSLPMLPQKMIDLGYKTSFYYGGDLNFGNMNTYLRNAGITNFVDGSDFDKKDWNSKWGAHDHILMERFVKDLATEQEEPFFKIALTLSSHEPYQFPDDYKFGKDSEDNLFRSSHTYTDKSIGKFIEFAKKQTWYKNTLIVIMADHGHSSPKHLGPFNSPKRFRIPMLWLGGALHKTGIEISTISSQVDFPYTLLDLLKTDNSSFTFSKNIFNTSSEQYAHYIFNKGFGTLNKNGVFMYDYVSKKPILEIGKNTSKLDSFGKSITQNAYQDFLERK